MAQMIKVWVGFMDTVPVIGTLKEGVDWALALYEENPEVVKEQIKSLKTNMYMSPNLREIEQIMLEELEREATAEPELIKRWKPVDTPEGEKEDPEGASGSGSASALQDVNVIELRELVEYVRSAPGSKKKVLGIEETLEKIRFLLPEYSLSPALQRETQGLKGDVHVFNNAVLTLCPKVLNEVLDASTGPDGIKENLKKGLYNLKPNIEDDIRNNMVATFDETEFYVNANSLVYDVCRSKMESLLLKLMRETHSHNHDNKRRLREIPYFMKLMEVYVDQTAKAKWIDGQTEKAERFTEAKGELHYMITGLDFNLCRNICSFIH